MPIFIEKNLCEKISGRKLSEEELQRRYSPDAPDGFIKGTFSGSENVSCKEAANQTFDEVFHEFCQKLREGGFSTKYLDIDKWETYQMYINSDTYRMAASNLETYNRKSGRFRGRDEIGMINGVILRRGEECLPPFDSVIE